MNGNRDTGSVRIDVWLWAARMYKTRSLAQSAIEAGRVLIDDRPCKPSRPVRLGDHLNLSRAGERLQFVVLGLAVIRGSASSAQSLYRETAASLAAREAAREHRRLQGTGYRAPVGRPDKRERREIRRLLDKH